MGESQKASIFYISFSEPLHEKKKISYYLLKFEKEFKIAMLRGYEDWKRDYLSKHSI